MSVQIDYVQSNKFPRDVRDVVNDLVQLANRQWEVKLADDFNPQGGSLNQSDENVILIVPRSGAGDVFKTHWYVSRANPPSGQTGIWLSVADWSSLLQSFDPTDYLAIDGVGDPFAFSIASLPSYVWCKVSISDGPILTAEIGHGTTWNGGSGNFFPAPVEFDTDDGTIAGSTGDAPENTKQIAFYFPLAIAFDSAAGDAPYPADTPGITLQNSIRLVQLAFTPMIIGAAYCFRGKGVLLAGPWHAHIAKP